MEKLQLNCLVAIFLREKYAQHQRKQKKVKTKSIKPKLMEKLNTNQFYASWSPYFVLRAYH